MHEATAPAKPDIHATAIGRCVAAIRKLIILAAGIPMLTAGIEPSRAQQRTPLHGEVRDPLGALVPNATVELQEGDRTIAKTVSGADGSFAFTLPESSRYRLRVTAASFQPATTPPVYLSKVKSTAWNVTLATRTLTQRVTVTATGTPTPQAQVGVSVTVLPADDYRNLTEVQDPLRLVAGAQVTQVGQIGGTTGLSIRGGETDANKVLIDGVPANQIGGAVEFANLATVGVQSVEVLEEPNSALYGPDALSGVVSLTSTRGTSRLPLFTYRADAGNFGSYRNQVTAGVAYRRFDGYSAFERMDTSNGLPNSEFHNATYAGNFGWTPTETNDLRFTVRHIAVSAGQANAIALYGIADDAQQKEQDDYYSVTWNNQAIPGWHNQLRYGGLRLHPSFNSFGATGIFNPATGFWDGAPVTIIGANGYSVHGQALFQYSDRPSQYLTPASRNFAYGQSTYSFGAHVIGLAAAEFEHESGAAGYLGSTADSVARNNYSFTLQISGDLGNRLFYNLGAGLEDDGLFGFAATPRASLVYYLVRPSAAGLFTGTKVHGSFGKGIKEPSVYEQTNSLYGLLAPLPDGPDLIGQYRVNPLGPEESRTFDGGVDQLFWNGRARAGITLFHNQFMNGVEYVPQQGLIELGVPAANLPPFEFGGAYLNSFSFRSQGVEFEAEYAPAKHLFARGGYTYTDAAVQRSFSSDNLAPSYNTSSNFGNIPIGAYSPLVGARPFRVAPHSGFFALTYTRARFYGSFAGSLIGGRDDSDFLVDANFGNSLLLPNRNLLGSYQKLELGGGYQLTPRVNVYTDIQNLLSEHYFEAFGYPSLPLTFRSGLKFYFGGEPWKLL